MTPRATLRTWPLWVRLVALITLLVAVGLLLAGVLSATLLHRFLVNQVDEKLRAEASSAVQETYQAFVRGDGEAEVPSDYYVEFQQSGENPLTSLPDRVGREYGTPQVHELTADEVAALGGHPFTVRSTTHAVWRAVAYRVRDLDGVIVVIALPLGDVDETITKMTAVLLVSGLGIVVLGGLTGGLAVRRSLRPLREMEGTAVAIAAGDLSRRVPPAPPSTEVGRLGAALNSMLTQIEQAFAARTASEARMRRFVADASHELRTPLATIRGYAELYRMGALPDRASVDDTMGRIEGSATRMGTLVEDLLALARLDEGRPLQHTDVDLVVLAEDAAADLTALDPGRQVRVVGLVDDQARPCPVTGDEARLRQVLANLVGNVVRHTPPGSPVELAVGTAQDESGRPQGVVEVRDHGPGIPPEHAARVFERFYRIDSSRTRDSGGTGLGMAIVASIVAAHGGQVTLAQTPDGGATIRVSLPAVPSNGTTGSGPGLP